MNRTKIHIYFVVRNLTQMREFLWSIDQDTSSILHKMGMSYFTRDFIVDIAQRKRELETFLGKFDSGNWTYSVDYETSMTYVFTISPSREQTRLLSFVFHCATPKMSADIDPDAADAIWLMTDGRFLIRTVRLMNIHSS